MPQHLLSITYIEYQLQLFPTMRFFILSVIACFAIVVQSSSASVASAAGQPMVMLRGQVSGIVAPGKVDLLFTDQAGAIIRCSSGSNGKYQTVLKSASSYKVLVTDQDLQRFTFTYDTPNTSSYMELTKDFVAQPAAPVAAEPAAKSKKKTKSKKATKK